MKKWTSWLLILTMMLALLPLPAAYAEDGVLNLPPQLTEIEEEAFMGNTSITTVVIPKTVQRIGARAFVGCTNLREVYFGRNDTIEIAKNAFDSGSDIMFYVFPQTKAWLYAVSHGMSVTLMEPDSGNAAYQRVMALVASNGGFSVMQSGEWASQRLIVKRADGRLPDISAFEPSDIVQDGDTFIIQFDDESTDNTIGCYSYLYGDANTVYVEADQYIETDDDVSAAGVVDGNLWGTDDPMGFDTYAPFVAQNAAPNDSVTIAVIDSGVKDLASYSSKLRRDGVNMLQAVDGESWTADLANHGSFIASVIADCVGQANVSILPIRVLGSNKNSGSDSGSSFTAIGFGIEKALELGADIINISQNFKESSFVTQKINKAVSAGIPVVVSAGNAHFNISKIYPANLDQVVTVGGLSMDYQLSANTNYGAGIDYTAPDSYVITSAYPGLLRQGTSFSAPMIAAALALVKLDPYHDVGDLNQTCTVSTEAGDQYSSYGRGLPHLDNMAKIDVTGIAFDNSLADILTVGEERELKWTVTPLNATDKTVTPISSDESVLSIVPGNDGKLYLKALEVGNSTVKLISNNNPAVSVVKSFTVVRPVTSITLSGGSGQLVLPKSVRLSATVEPANATNRNLQWFSTNENVATVDASGNVKSVAEGQTSIYAVAADGYGTVSNRVDIEVVTAPDPSGMTLTVDGADVTNGSISMAPGEIKIIESTVLPEGAPQNVTYRAVFGGSRITVSNEGTVTAISSGNAAIEVTSEDGKASATLEITIRILPETVTVEGKTTIDENEVTAFTATVLPTNAYDRGVIWSSTNPAVAPVGSNGSVTGISSGTTTIIATANGDPTVTGQITVTVRHPFTLSFDLNGGGDNAAFNANNARTAYSGYSLTGLPAPSRDYYDFLGWYTTPSTGGERIAEGGSITTTSSAVTLYARWYQHPESDWVLVSSMPSNATETQRSYSYRVYTENTSSTYSDWIQYENNWKQTGTGSSYYASFPSSYNTSDQYYKNYMKQPYSTYNDGATKREVSNVQEGYIYWHWMYNVAYANSTGRMISYKKGTYNNWAYSYFHAMASNTNCSKYTGSTNYYGGTADRYNARDVILDMTTSSQRNDSKSGIGTNLYFRINRMKSTYTDYTMYYKHYKDVAYSSSPASTWTNLGYTTGTQTTYVKYRLK